RHQAPTGLIACIAVAAGPTRHEYLVAEKSNEEKIEGDTMLLAGKKVVVVGGSSGIGLSTAELAKSEGAEIWVASRNADRLKAVADRLGAKAIPTDVTNDESVVNLFRQCGPIDHVVVTAAQLRSGPFKT